MQGVFKSYKRFMEFSSTEIHEVEVDELCIGCRNHRPDWDYRFCRFIECPYIEGMKTFKEETFRCGGVYARGD